MFNFSSFDPNDTTFSVERLEHKYLTDIYSCESNTRNTLLTSHTRSLPKVSSFNNYRDFLSCQTSLCQKAITFLKKNCEMIVFQLFCLACPIHQVHCDNCNARFTCLETKSDQFFLSSLCLPIKFCCFSQDNIYFLSTTLQKYTQHSKKFHFQKSYNSQDNHNVMKYLKDWLLWPSRQRALK